ncbi:MAG: hypothetical protein A2951_01310 [Candidatus Buchananbacteria bacterium RIFCSPLOWO2_01_FULL_56_15]|uniref:Uncharacterized protein n=2 Tax=Candidatus Buchananiibacteriota TaxID=1817903 RepID=A0A1G1YHZ8_9BACT|nr:MAG: hypothetical protein A3J59_05135 [Candidatus Buchananbacteria bacterium RIFCSPHIGHO2_02_FULL_56_16]OGY54600.1 MAG: hypothetical protein A2951_01310 [Candidatus Buchananbacteria bacterium RIFCSPLOWO2_01_FULL_56_15]
MVTKESIRAEQRLVALLAGLVAAVTLSAATNGLLLTRLLCGAWPHGAPIPISFDLTLTLPALLTSRWWDVSLAPLLAIYLVWITSWMMRASHQFPVVGFISLGLPLIGCLAAVVVNEQCSLLKVTLCLVPLTFLIGAGAGGEHGSGCLHDAFVALLVSGVPASCLPGAVSFGLLPGLLVAVPLFLTFFVSLTVGVYVGATLTAPFRSLHHWLHPAAH